MIIESEKVTVEKPIVEVFNFLFDLNNLETLMPKDKITDWKSDENTCSFTIQGMAQIGMKIDNSNPNTLINIVSNGKNPFEFKLDVHLKPISESSTEGYLKFDGDVNPFMKMMIEKPLSNFFNHLAKQLTIVLK